LLGRVLVGRTLGPVRLQFGELPVQLRVAGAERGGEPVAGVERQQERRPADLGVGVLARPAEGGLHPGVGEQPAPVQPDERESPQVRVLRPEGDQRRLGAVATVDRLQAGQRRLTDLGGLRSSAFVSRARPDRP
jgi:hypothetical protein